MRPFIPRPKPTRAQWLAACHPVWRELLSKIKEGPEEIALGAGVSLRTVRRHLGEGHNGQGGTYADATRAILRAVLRFSGLDIRDDHRLDDEAMHLYQRCLGKEPHVFSTGYSLTAPRPEKSCMLCDPSRDSRIRAAYRRHVRAIVALRRAAGKYLLSPEEWKVVSSALLPQSYAAYELALGAEEYGLSELTAQILPDPEERCAALEGRWPEWQRAKRLR